ncbi:hypothetical protein DL96DRAFT_1573631 [Flagelloscypha sp. PMI_526]|nr:hypothetical protein DL96DRAFT_1573631 [Flagelloscypha sp. PMI_526]
MASVPKAVLYYSPNDPWSTAVRFTVLEKGYSKDELDLKVVDIGSAAKGKVPTLVAPLEDTLSDDAESRFKSISDPKALVAFLDKSRSAQSHTQPPATIASSTIISNIVDLLHNPKHSPDLLLVYSARDTESLTKLRSQLQPSFQSRKQALTAYLADAEKESIKASPKVRTLWNEELEKIRRYEELVSSETAYLEATKSFWEGTLSETLLALEKEITSPLSCGDQLSLADPHLAAWLTRLVVAAGGSPDQSGNAIVEHLEAVCNTKLPKEFSAAESDNRVEENGQKQAKIAAFWDAITARPHWKEL